MLLCFSSSSTAAVRGAGEAGDLRWGLMRAFFMLVPREYRTVVWHYYPNITSTCIEETSRVYLLTHKITQINNIIVSPNPNNGK